MTTILIREYSSDVDGSFAVRVDFGEDGGADVRVKDPADAEREQLLAWYFEEHLRYPFLDKDLEARAVKEIAAYGDDLFTQVFSGEAAFGYRRARDRGFDGCRIVVQGSAAFHRLHWEALRDPDNGRLLALHLPMTRRVERVPLQFELPTHHPELRILVVTARPGGANDVGYRTISRPLLDALRQARLPVSVDIVRPGTWEALRDKLRDASRDHGTGWYQVVHFDVHGGFGAASAAGSSRYLFDAAAQGFIYFETDTAGKSQEVAAAKVAELLADHRVAVAVLNACQSAMQTGSEASLAQELAAAGAPVAVGMSYSVTVSAAARAMPVFYGKLAEGADPVTAAWVMRQALHNSKSRRGYFDHELDLEDWMLPVVFGQRDLKLHLRDMTAGEQEAFYARQAEVSAEPHVEYGFLGRDLDIHGLERQLLLKPERNQVLIQGLAGTGKSTLLAHVGWWWRRTGLVDRQFSFSYENRAWTADQIIRSIATVLMDPIRLAQWDSMADPAKTEQVAAVLRAHHHLLILDNAESITASPAAIPHALSEVERGRLADFLARLRGGRTLVLIGSREAETWLAPSSFGDSVYALGGLDPQAASALLERILGRHGGHRYLTTDADPQERQALQNLMKLLGGYPLPMTVVLPQLAVSPPSTVLEELRAGGEEADPVGKVRRAIEYSHGKLDPAVQQSMLLLAPFTAVIPVAALGIYAEALAKHEPVRSLGAIDLPGAVEELARVGLAGPHAVLSNYVQIVPVLPYFLRNKLSRAQAGVGAIANQAHHELYAKLGQEFRRLLTDNDPEKRKLGRAAVAADYSNLIAAIDHGLQSGRAILGALAAIEEYLDQSQQQGARSQLIEAAIAAYRHVGSMEQQRELMILHNLAGAVALVQRRFDDAQRHYEIDLKISTTLGKRRDLSPTYHALGQVAQEARRFEQAESFYRQALEIDLESGDRQGAANTYGQLGVVTQELGQLDEAESLYLQALDVFLEFGDRHSAAGAHAQLGAVAHRRGRLEEAESLYRRALDVFLEFGDGHSAASTYHQMGILAQRVERFDQAELFYRQALAICMDFGDRYEGASTYHQLGMVAQDLRRFEQAESYYRQALDIFLEFGDRYNAADTYHNLGVLYSLADRPAEAVEALLNAAVSQFATTGAWAHETFGVLRPLLATGDFELLVARIVPGEIRKAFDDAIAQADEDR